VAYGSGRTSVSSIVLLGAGLTIVAALVLLAAPVGYRLGVVSLGFALRTLLRWGAYLAVGAAVVSLIGLLMTFVRPNAMRRGRLLAAASLIMAATMVAIPARFRMGPPAPPIHDITTDTQDPPEYVAVLPRRADAPNPTEYAGERVAAQQRDAYPDLQPALLDVAPSEAFERALAAVHEMGWELVEADAAAGRIEATDTTFWFGFKDDVVIRIRPADGGSRVDVRSLSRIGVGDAGTNARRIRAYLNVLRREGRTGA
jgi:uncharacterized protein (DUF1499 family)